MLGASPSLKSATAARRTRRATTWTTWRAISRGHRISGGPRVILHQNGSGAAALIRVAAEEGADLLVTGVWTVQPPRRMDVRRRDPRPARDQSDLLSHVSLKVGCKPARQWRRTMQTPVEIDFQGMTSTPKIQAAIAAQVVQLEERFGRVTACASRSRRRATAVTTAVSMRSTSGWRCPTAARSTSRARRSRRAPCRPRVRAQRCVQARAPAPAGRCAACRTGSSSTTARRPGRWCGSIRRASRLHRRRPTAGDLFPPQQRARRPERLEPGARVSFAEEMGEKGPQASTVKLLGKHELRA